MVHRVGNFRMLFRFVRYCLAWMGQVKRPTLPEKFTVPYIVRFDSWHARLEHNNRLNDETEALVELVERTLENDTF